MKRPIPINRVQHRIVTSLVLFVSHTRQCFVLVLKGTGRHSKEYLIDIDIVLCRCLIVLDTAQFLAQVSPLLRRDDSLLCLVNFIAYQDNVSTGVLWTLLSKSGNILLDAVHTLSIGQVKDKDRPVTSPKVRPCQ